MPYRVASSIAPDTSDASAASGVSHARRRRDEVMLKTFGLMGFSVIENFAVEWSPVSVNPPINPCKIGAVDNCTDTRSFIKISNFVGLCITHKVN